MSADLPAYRLMMNLRSIDTGGYIPCFYQQQDNQYLYYPYHYTLSSPLPMASNEGEDAVAKSGEGEENGKPAPRFGAEGPNEVPHNNPFSLSREASFEDFPHPFAQALGSEFPPILMYPSNQGNEAGALVETQGQAVANFDAMALFHQFQGNAQHAYSPIKPDDDENQDRKLSPNEASVPSVSSQMKQEDAEEDDRKPSPVDTARVYDNINIFVPEYMGEGPQPAHVPTVASLQRTHDTSPSASSSSNRKPSKRSRTRKKTAPKRKSRKAKSTACKESPSAMENARKAKAKIQKLQPTMLEIKSAPNERARWALESWYDRFNDFREYFAEHGHGRVPQKYAENHALGIWVNKQREEKKKYDRGERTSLTERRISLLENANFEWAKAKGEAAWEDKFQELVQYKDIYGHCDVPTKYEENRALGRWVSAQRLSYNRFLRGEKSNLTKERVGRLNRLDFSWKMLPGFSQESDNSNSAHSRSSSETDASSQVKRKGRGRKS